MQCPQGPSPPGRLLQMRGEAPQSLPAQHRAFREACPAALSSAVRRATRQTARRSGGSKLLHSGTQRSSLASARRLHGGHKCTSPTQQMWERHRGAHKSTWRQDSPCGSAPHPAQCDHSTCSQVPVQEGSVRGDHGGEAEAGAQRAVREGIGAPGLTSPAGSWPLLAGRSRQPCRRP